MENEKVLDNQKLKIISARDQVAAYIRKNIYTGNFKPGEEIRQERLSKELGVSRTPIREAIHLLCNDGLLTQEHHKGAMVREITEREIREKRYVYAILKSEIIKLALQNGLNNEALKEIKMNLAEAYQDKDYRQMSFFDDCLNELLYEACDNRELIKLCVNMAAKGLSYLPDTSISTYPEKLYPLQCDLIDNLLQGNLPECQRLVMDIEMITYRQKCGGIF